MTKTPCATKGRLQSKNPVEVVSTRAARARMREMRRSTTPAVSASQHDEVPNEECAKKQRRLVSWPRYGCVFIGGWALRCFVRVPSFTFCTSTDYQVCEGIFLR